jgi:hypothetical protein
MMEYKQGLEEEGNQAFQRVRFLENHDEDRLAAAFPGKALRSTAVIHATSPGLRLFHHGQLEGRRIKMPVQLGREPEEGTDPDVVSFYERLLHVIKAPVFKEGNAHVLEVTPAFDGDKGFQPVVGFAYSHGKEVGVVAVNQGERVASGYLCFSEGFWSGWGHVNLRERVAEPETEHLREGKQLQLEGLYVQLEPYAFHVLTATR